MPSDWQDAQRRFYDATADEYDENFQQANPYFAFVLDRSLAAAGPRPPGSDRARTRSTDSPAGSSRRTRPRWRRRTDAARPASRKASAVMVGYCASSFQNFENQAPKRGATDPWKRRTRPRG